MMSDFHDGGDAESISDDYGVTQSYVRDLIRSKGIDYGGVMIRRRKKLILEETAPMIEDYLSGMYVREVAEKYGIKPVTLNARFRRYGVKLRDRGSRRRFDYGTDT
jgi:hypothetical protein